MGKGKEQLLGNAGVYFLAARLNARGYHAAPTFGNVPCVDLLMSTPDGSVSIALQVKTTSYALRYRGRGAEKKPDHYEWAMSWPSARLNRTDLFFAFVDLKDFAELPDVFIVPSEVVHKYYEGGDPKTWKWPRYHPTVAELEPYKNGWELLEKHLTSQAH